MPTDPTVGIPGLEDTLSVRGDARLEPEPERRVGPYRLLQLIGEGGVGEVWLAEQVEPRRRQPARPSAKPPTTSSVLPSSARCASTAGT